jgi:hypothetical protein
VTADLLLFSLLLFGLPIVVITLIVVAAMTAARRRKPSLPVALPDQMTRQAWASAWQVHVRLAQLEGRVRELERRDSTLGERGGAA